MTQLVTKRKACNQKVDLSYSLKHVTYKLNMEPYLIQKKLVKRFVRNLFYNLFHDLFGIYKRVWLLKKGSHYNNHR